MKTIIKIIYIAFALIVAVILGLGMYTSFASQNYTTLLKNAVAKADEAENYQDADYNDIVRCFSIFSTPLEDAPTLLYAEEDGKNITFIYESVNQHISKYTVDGNENENSKIDNIYLVVILHPDFYYNTLSDKTNPAGFQFVGTNGEKFTYEFNLSKDCNPDKYIETPTSDEESALYGGRTLLDTYREEYDLIFFPLSETTMGYVKEEIGSDIQGFNIVNNNNDPVYKNTTTIDFKFEYNSEFFTEMADFVKYYNIVEESKANVGDHTEDEASAASKYVQTFMENPSDIIPDFKTKYIQGYAYENVYTGADMVMKTIGIIALFAVAAALVYILLFHFQTIKRFVRKFSKKEEPERQAPNIRPRTQVTISKSKVKKDVATEAPVIEAKVEAAEEAKTPVEEVKEEAAEEPKVEEEVEETEEAKVEEVVEDAPALEATEEAKEE